MDSTPPAFGMACSGLPPLTLDFVLIGLLPSPQSFHRAEFALPIYGVSRLDFTLLILDLVHVDPNLSIQTPA